MWDYLEDALMNLGFHNHVCNITRTAVSAFWCMFSTLEKYNYVFLLASEGSLGLESTADEGKWIYSSEEDTELLR